MIAARTGRRDSVPPGTDRMICTGCGTVVPIEEMPSTCPACDGILDLELGPSGPSAGYLLGGLSRGIWEWERWLPRCAPKSRVTLGEGSSPLFACPHLGETLGLDNLFIKADAVQPSGSFKDRAVALATSLAVEHGRRGLVLSSSGNAGASSAAYAARAGLPLMVLVPKTAPRSKLRQIVLAGARLVTIDGATHDCCRLAKEVAERMGWVNLTTTFHNPYGVDAYATIAYELAELKPDVLLLPISSGPLLAGMMKGFERLKSEGLVARIPRPIAVQTAACAPIVAAFEARGSVQPPSPGLPLLSGKPGRVTGGRKALTGCRALTRAKRRCTGFSVAPGPYRQRPSNRPLRA